MRLARGITQWKTQRHDQIGRGQVAHWPITACNSSTLRAQRGGVAQAAGIGDEDVGLEMRCSGGERPREYFRSTDEPGTVRGIQDRAMQV